MADLARIKRNVVKMVGLSAPEADIDAYIASEGVTVDDVRAFKPEATPIENASAMSQKLKGGPGPQPAPKRDLVSDLIGSTAATMGGLVNGIPVAGPLLQMGTDAVIAGGNTLMGGDFGKTYGDLQNRRKEIAAAYPVADIAGQIGGSVASMGAAGGVKPLADALGMTGKFLPRVLNSAASGAALSAADTAVRGGDLGESLTSGGIGGLLSGAIPVVGKGFSLAGNALGRVLQPTVGAIQNAPDEALRRTGMALGRDLQGNPSSVMNAADETVAAQNAVPLINADRGGETVRALSRSVANQSPEARGVIEKVASDRFGGQADRAVQFVRRIAGGPVDDLAYRDSIKQAGQAVNRPAYDAAFNAPAARAVWNDPIKELMQSDTFRAAINMAEKRGTDRAAISGFKAVRNPFEFLPDGTPTLKMRSTIAREELKAATARGDAGAISAAKAKLAAALQKDGPDALPSLQFWDQVKRNIDGMIGQAQRGGDNTLVADLTQIKQKLTGALDLAVPQYQKARSGAAAFFGAEDALDAGKMFATQTRQIPEATRAFNAMKPAEQAAFRTGYASEIIDKIKDARFRANVIDSAFGSPAKREMMELVFGKGHARELEAYVRVEELADKLRGAMGNSTTARQLMELGIGAGSGAVLTGGDWKGALTGAGIAKGARYFGQRVDNKVMMEVAKLLTSNDPALMQKAVYQASLSPMWMDALEAWGKLLAAPARGVVQQQIGQTPAALMLPAA